MVESDDWVLPYSSQAAIMELALLMEKHREFATDRDLLKVRLSLSGLARYCRKRGTRPKTP